MTNPDSWAPVQHHNKWKHVRKTIGCALLAREAAYRNLGTALVFQVMDNHLERYMELCKRMCERMERDGTWPWADSPNTDSQDSDEMVESKDNPHDI